MKTVTWHDFHLPRLPHRHHTAQKGAEHPHERWRALFAGVLAAYLAVLAILLIAARTVWAMDAGEAWAFAIGVASYILLFSGFIGGLVWVCVNNLADDPSRR